MRRFAPVFFALLFILPLPVGAGTYAEITKPTNARYGPGTTYKVAKVLRTGSVVEIAETIKKKDRTWYKIKQDAGLRYPERVAGAWYVAADLVRVRTAYKAECEPLKKKKNGKRIIVDISAQKLYAMDGDKLFMSASVSTGNKTTPTPKGTFSIFRKTPSRYMQGPLPGISKQYFDLPGVPWTMYFTEQGAAIHGAYWHESFGATHSNGCVNLPVAKARQLYTWADVGTTVVVRQ